MAWWQTRHLRSHDPHAPEAGGVVCHVVVCKTGTAIDEPKTAGVLRACSLLSGFRLKSPRAAEPMEGSTSAMKPWWGKDVPTMSRWQQRKYHRHCQRMQNAVHDGQAGNDASNQGFQPVLHFQPVFSQSTAYQYIKNIQNSIIVPPPFVVHNGVQIMTSYPSHSKSKTDALAFYPGGCSGAESASDAVQC